MSRVGPLTRLHESGWPVEVENHRRGAVVEDAWPRRCRAALGQVIVIVIGLDDLVEAQRAAGRPQDRDDAKLLEAARELTR